MVQFELELHHYPPRAPKGLGKLDSDDPGPRVDSNAPQKLTSKNLGIAVHRISEVTPANGNLSKSKLSHSWGSLQNVSIGQAKNNLQLPHSIDEKLAAVWHSETIQSGKLEIES